MGERGSVEPHSAGDVERQDLEVLLETRRELGPEYEAALVDSFVDRIETAIETRVDARMAEVRQTDKTERQAQKQQMVLGIVSLGTGIPITAIAAVLGDGLPGVFVAWAGIAAVNIAHALQGRRR
ncbi:MAG: hypothetical protein ACRDPJ_08105 [Nocardioidaceae bacterium]